MPLSIHSLPESDKATIVRGHTPREEKNIEIKRLALNATVINTSQTSQHGHFKFVFPYSRPNVERSRTSYHPRWTDRSVVHDVSETDPHDTDFLLVFVLTVFPLRQGRPCSQPWRSYHLLNLDAPYYGRLLAARPPPQEHLPQQGPHSRLPLQRPCRIFPRRGNHHEGSTGSG